MPVSPLVAEEIADIVPAPETVAVPDIEEATEPIEVPIDSVCETSTSTPVIVENEVASSSPIIITPIESVPAPVVNFALPEETPEDNFTTLSESEITPVLGEISLSEENTFETLTGTPIDDLDNLAISEENPFGEELDATEPALSDENYFITLGQIEDNLIVSNEGSFNTLNTPVDTLTVSSENSFVTQTSPSTDPTVSPELSFTTLDLVTDLLGVSSEHNFSTLPGVVVTDPAISAENYFVTLSIPLDTLAVSSEHNFITLDTPVDTLVVSEENSFITLSNPDDRLTVSDEVSFTTLDIPGGPDGGENSFTTLSSEGCTSNCGGGGGGGGGGSSGGIVLAEKVYRCPIYLYKFIKFGEANDRREVIKLQAFLKVYEGFSNLKITGVYDRETFEAVKTFQRRYLSDVLKPWQINYATGWVYITTRQAINNIYCGRDTKNDLLFRKLVAEEYYRATGENIEAPIIEPTDGGYFIVPTSTATTSSVLKPNVFLAGVGELLDFISENFCWLLNLLLLLLIFFLLWLLWQENRESEEFSDRLDDHESEIGSFGILPPEDEDELAKLAEEDESKLDILDNNPWQEAIVLGPETTEEK